MTALAQAGAHVHAKISMAVYVDANWDDVNSVVPSVVREIIDLFGPQRYVCTSLRERENKREYQRYRNFFNFTSTSFLISAV